MKADSTFTIAELKDVIRGANKPNKYRKGAGLKLTGSKKELQARLKSVGRWREVAPAKKAAPNKPTFAEVNKEGTPMAKWISDASSQTEEGWTKGKVNARVKYYLKEYKGKSLEDAIDYIKKRFNNDKDIKYGWAPLPAPAKKTNIIDELDVESLRTGLRRWGKAKKVSMRGISAGDYDGLIKTIKRLRETGSAKGVKLTNEDISVYFKKEKRKPGKGEKYMWVEGKKVIAPIMT